MGGAAALGERRLVSTGLRVLVVDDEEVIRDVLERLLEREGWTVNTAENAAEALEVFDSDPHDVVLLDLMRSAGPTPLPHTSAIVA